jgi:prevent-host-death family protein
MYPRRNKPVRKPNLRNRKPGKHLQSSGEVIIVGNLATLWSFSWRKPFPRPPPTAKFSLLLRGVREGRSYVVTSHGKPVARLIPAGKDDEAAKRARATLLSRLEKQPVMNAERWTRDELYEDIS